VILDPVSNFLTKFQGGLIALEFYTPNGRLVTTTGDVIIGGFKVGKRPSFAWWVVGEDSAHSMMVEAVIPDGDEFRLIGVPEGAGDRIVAVVSPMWLPEQRKALKEWTAKPESVMGELQALVDARDAETLPQVKLGSGKRFRGSYLSAFNEADQELKTAGVLVEGDGEIICKCWEEHASIQQTMTNRLEAMTVAPGDAFDRLVETANGITQDLSVPFDIHADSIESAADAALAQSTVR
jgi:hypothetical protein